MIELEGRAALVTGAGRGIGAACAKSLAQAGAGVLVTDRNDRDGHTTTESLCAVGLNAHYLPLDVTDESAWGRAVEYARETLGGLDVLVNNAGVASASRPLETLELASWRRLMSINLDGVFLGIKHAIPVMAEHSDQIKGGASIINVSSVMGFVGGTHAAAYCASKGGVRLLTKAAAVELAPRKIRVNSVHPGYIDTPLFQSGVTRMEETSAGAGHTFVKKVIRRHPLGRLGQEQDIANAVTYLASGMAAFVTGTELVVDGGYLAQ